MLPQAKAINKVLTDNWCEAISVKEINQETHKKEAEKQEHKSRRRKSLHTTLIQFMQD